MTGEAASEAGAARDVAHRRLYVDDSQQPEP
jgi:hypothetical protein